ncbi:molybdate ABC transporter substrate-binding protein [Planococcus koreensis]|uniref:molybdate ABC transporter substrate-binding protein n=1 Tax=Planococcus koreensis TaxID=112331 RepID=UPI0039FC77D8
MRLKNKFMLLALSSFFVAACAAEPAAKEETLMVSAASSLSGAMDELASGFEQDNPGIAIVTNLGSSSKLRSQIENGAPADVFLSASAEDVELLVEDGLADVKSVSPFAGNQLVLASSSEIGEAPDVKSMLASFDGTFAIAEPASVPLGGYTKKALEAIGMWQPLEGQLIYAKDARQVVTYLESGNANAGVIYASDAALSETVKDMDKMPLESVKINYPAALLSNSEQPDHAGKFLAYLLSEEGQAIIEEYGFLTAERLQP